MRREVDPLNVTIKNAKMKAVGAMLLANISIFALSGSILLDALGYKEENVPIYFYPGLVFTVLMVIRWLPSIFISLRSNDFLVKNENGGVSIFGLADNFSRLRFLSYSEIREVNIELTLLKRNMIFKLNDESTIKVPIIFSNYRQLLVR